MTRALAAAALLVLAPQACATQPGQAGPLRGTETGLPIDAELVGAWWRRGTEELPAEAVHYARSGLYVRVAEGAGTEKGIWVTWVGGGLRWLRRCPARGGPQVSPADCEYFGRYMVEGQEAVEEEVCPEAWEGSLTGRVGFDQARGRCDTPTLRFGDLASPEALREKAREAAADSPEAAPRPPRPAGTSARAAGEAAEPVAAGVDPEVVGTWVGAMGEGVEQVTLTFEALGDGKYVYTLSAGGQEESASGEWSADTGSIVLQHPDGTVEHIPYKVQGDLLEWQDEDLGALPLKRSE